MRLGYSHVGRQAPPRLLRVPALPVREPFSQWRAPKRAAITTENGVVAGLRPVNSIHKASFTGEAAGQWHDLATLAGIPAARAFAAPGLNGATVDNTSAIGGMIPWTNPSSGNAYLARLSASIGANLIGLMIYDLLWYNTGLVVATTTAQNITFPTIPTRCVPSTGGPDDAADALGGRIEAWMLSTTATTNAGAITNSTISYTDQDNNAGAVGTIIAPGWPISAVAGTMVPFSYAAGDTGMRSVQSVTLGTSYAGGAISLLVLRVLTRVFFSSASSGGTFNWADLGLPRAYNGSALYMAALLSGTAAGNVSGEVNFAHG